MTLAPATTVRVRLPRPLLGDWRAPPTVDVDGATLVDVLARLKSVRRLRDRG